MSHVLNHETSYPGVSGAYQKALTQQMFIEWLSCAKYFLGVGEITKQKTTY